MAAKNKILIRIADVVLMRPSNSNGAFLIDERDFDAIKDYKWSVNNCGYLQTNMNGAMVFMHRHIMQPNGMQIDHINGRPWDNRRSNLRLATKSQNQQNKGPLRNNVSGKKGVSFIAASRKWEAQIKYTEAGQRKQKRRSFNTLEAAALWYNIQAVEHHRDFAYLNDLTEYEFMIAIFDE